MKLSLKNAPRVFTIGAYADIVIRDLGDVHLAPDEQLTFVTEAGRRYDVVRKDWGFYVTPSINSRLRKEGFKTALMENTQGRLYVTIVEMEKLALFETYCAREGQRVLRWLDEDGRTVTDTL
jgi:hypothetical protein